MRATLLSLALALAGCSGTPTCQDLVHKACDLDGGPGCDAHSSCVSASVGVDLCAGGSSSCCYLICSGDADCPNGQACVPAGSIKACAQGRCLK